MWKFLLGPLLLGAICITGSIYGANAEQVVHKPPSLVRAAIGQAVANRSEGIVPLEGGQPLAYALKLDRISDERMPEQMVITLMMNGKQGAEIGLSFAPQDDGKNTLITAKIHTDHAVLREALAGTSKAKLGYAPDWVFNLTIRPVLRKFADQIESGEALGDPIQGFQSRADWEAQLPPDQQREVQEWRQYDAARPAVDPNDAARDYLKGQ
ncbi:MAG TPA: hypothetical protein VK485_10795, partial [Sphingomicrobium sp.]|nr:hypothetical protein [Sphingomicrobium sp.]